MRISNSSLFFLLALAITLPFASCKKDDVTKPVVTLVGANPLNVPMAATFTDPGATATDDVDGDLTAEIVVTGTVVADSPGVYTLTYSATDAAGNVGTASRTVNVQISRDGLLGTYHSTNNCQSPYNGVATAPNFQAGSGADKFVINTFYYNGGTLSCTLSGNDVTVDAGQTPNPLFDGVTGSGTVSTNGKVVTMNFTFQPNGGSPVSCTVVYTRQ